MFNYNTGEDAATAEELEEDEPDKDEEPFPSSISLKYGARIRKCSRRQALTT